MSEKMGAKEEIEVTPEMIAAGLEVAERYDDPGTFQPVTIDGRALAAVYTAMRRLEVSCATALMNPDLAHHAELAPAETALKSEPTLVHEVCEFWFVWNKRGRAPRHVHKTAESAELEASRLAKLYPWRRFVVLRAYQEVYALTIPEVAP